MKGDRGLKTDKDAGAGPRKVRTVIWAKLFFFLTRGSPEIRLAGNGFAGFNKVLGQFCQILSNSVTFHHS